ncbi:MAG: molybdopterin-guanine dinucleotide biosynthesis protein B [Proteobacteria bacterium]|nr:molybdopterin-guanine dinucleotide biosynthesis protein B [Pseudomonadota bacterium]
MKIFGLAGWSGSGKTTLLVHLLHQLTARGLRVSTVKHAHHNFDIDQPGKDSYAHRSAGATEVMVSAANRWALMHENRGGPEPDLNELISHMSAVDLVLVEGFKSYPHSKLEVHRAVQGKPVLCHQDTHIVAVASDVSLPDLTVPVIHLDDIPAIADFILSHCDITVPAAKSVV